MMATDEIKARASALHQQGLTLLKELDAYVAATSKAPINNLLAMRRSLSTETKFFERCSLGKVLASEAHVSTSNIPWFSAWLAAIKEERDVTAVGKWVSAPSGIECKVDIVSREGLCWTKVKALSYRNISRACNELEKHGDRNVLVLARNLLECAKASPVCFRTPLVVFRFENGVSTRVAAQLKQLGVHVIGEIVAFEEEDELVEAEAAAAAAAAAVGRISGSSAAASASATEAKSETKAAAGAAAAGGGAVDGFKSVESRLQALFDDDDGDGDPEPGDSLDSDGDGDDDGDGDEDDDADLAAAIQAADRARSNGMGAGRISGETKAAAAAAEGKELTLEEKLQQAASSSGVSVVNLDVTTLLALITDLTNRTPDPRLLRRISCDEWKTIQREDGQQQQQLQAAPASAATSAATASSAAPAGRSAGGAAAAGESKRPAAAGGSPVTVTGAPIAKKRRTGRRGRRAQRARLEQQAKQQQQQASIGAAADDGASGAASATAAGATAGAAAAAGAGAAGSSASSVPLSKKAAKRAQRSGLGSDDLDAVLAAMVEDEVKRPAKPIIEQYLRGKELIICETALRKFKGIIETVAGPEEQARAAELLKKLKVVADSPSARSLKLSSAKQSLADNRTIFGTGDQLRAVTITGNSSFVRSCVNAGCAFACFVHPARALTERYRIARSRQLGEAGATASAAAGAATGSLVDAATPAGVVGATGSISASI